MHFPRPRTLKHDSQKIAQKILSDQRIRLENFLLSVNLLFLITLVITVIMIFLIARRQVLLRRELEAQAELRRTEKTLQETEELHSKFILPSPMSLSEQMSRARLFSSMMSHSRSADTGDKIHREKISWSSLLRKIRPLLSRI